MVKKEEREGPELFLGLVGAAGTNFSLVCDKLTEALEKVYYKSEVISLSSLLNDYEERLKVKLVSSPEDKRILSYMDAGDKFREKVGEGSALAVLAISQIRKIRKKFSPKLFAPRQAYIFKSLKHEDEVNLLRDTYGNNFWLISIYSPSELRVQNLSKIIADTRNEGDPLTCRPYADTIIQRDEYDPDTESGQHVRDTFPLGDVFVDASDEISLTKSVERFVELIFGNTFHTPTKEEYGMFCAFGSALRSSSLARQVGASITTPEGDVISTGTNEVPKFGGGLYSSDSKIDFREFIRGIDSNDEKKKQLLKDFLQKLINAKWLSKDKTKLGLDKLTQLGFHKTLKDAQLMNLTEFGREVHAEMASLMDASRRTIQVNGCDLYCTTFPCHVCAKHIVASGIRRVVYIEPYPKSLAKQLFPDSISLDVEQIDKVDFRPFVGIHPRKYRALFQMEKRKDKKTKKMISWVASKANLRYYERIPIYNFLEQRLAKILTMKIKQNLPKIRSKKRLQKKKRR